MLGKFKYVHSQGRWNQSVWSGHGLTIFLVANPTIKYFTRFIYLVIKTLSFAQAFVNGVCVCMTESANVFANSSQCCHTAMQALFSRKGMIHSI